MFSCLQILEAFLWFVVITLLNVTLMILTVIVSRLLNRVLRVVSDMLFLFFQAEDGIRDLTVTGVQTCALPISASNKVDKRQRQGHELCIESQHGWEAVQGLQGAYQDSGYWRLRRYSSDYKVLLDLAREIESRLRQRGYQATIAYKAKFVAASGIQGSFMTIPAAGV